MGATNYMKPVGGDKTSEFRSFSGEPPTVLDPEKWVLWRAPEGGAGKFHLVGESWDVWFCRQVLPMLGRARDDLRAVCLRLIDHGGQLRPEERTALSNAQNGAARF